MKKEFYSNGKLLITGEYLVLDGARALALPTKFGQKLSIENGTDKLIHWKSYDKDNSVWFEETIPFSSVIRKEQFDDEQNIKNKLIEILHEAYLINSNFITQSDGYIITTALTFERNWGLGTSSTLINNIAQWLEIDAYDLLKKSFGGSGYDIACAQNNSAIIYQLLNDSPKVEIIDFKPSFQNKIFFVYLNRKQNSRDAIASYYTNQVDYNKVIPVINCLTEDVINAIEPKEFALSLQQHEIEMSNVLEMTTIQERYFQDFKGVIKSLGAWNGDFILSISKDNPIEYFKSKGFETVIPYSEMIL